MAAIDDQMRILAQGAAEIVTEGDLRAMLSESARTGRPLTVKLGLDPTAPDIHLGHTVVLRKVRQLQDMGHRAVLIIGDFTGRIGDPTGKSKTRPQLTEEAVQANARTYEEQLSAILDPARTEYRFNSRWLGAMGFADVVTLASKSTVARMLERDDFQRRFTENRSIGLHELLYPLMQAHDSVEIGADIELGGTDQRFNILAGRDLQAACGQARQAAIFMPLLEGVDGREKMSKSLNNAIGIHEPPDGMYGKVMSIPDGLILRYFELATDIGPDELDRVRSALAGGEMNPRDAKMRLAREITTLYHGGAAAGRAEERFVRVHRMKELPDALPSFAVPEDCRAGNGVDMARLLARAGLAASTSEARRLLMQGAVRVNGAKLGELKTEGLRSGDVLQAGKVRAVRLLL